MSGAIEVINMLKNEGHELIIITARGGIIKEMKDVAQRRFEENKLEFDKYYWVAEDKLEICKKKKLI